MLKLRHCPLSLLAIIVVGCGSSAGVDNTGTPTPVASVALSATNAMLTTGQTLQVTATPRDAAGNALSGRTVTWASSTPGVASVSSTGLVTAVAAGATSVTATSEGESASIAVTVNAATQPPVPVATVVINATKTAFTVGDSAAFTATTKDAQGNVLVGRTVTWSSTPTTVASVSSAGVVTAISAGSATITATSEGVSGTSIVTVTASTVASLLEQHIIAQQGLAIALASTVLQSQLVTLIEVAGGGDPFDCNALAGGGSAQTITPGGVLPEQVVFYFDTSCTRPYMNETVTQFTETDGATSSDFHIVATAAYTGPTGTALGSIAFDEAANNIQIDDNAIRGTVNGLGTYTPPGGAFTVRLGLNCDFGAGGHSIGICQGGIAQNFTALGRATGSVSTLALDSSATGALTFAGSSVLTSGALSALTLTQPTTTAMVVNGGTPYGTTTASGGAGTFSLFPPTPTGWSVADSANDEVFTISVIDNASRNLGGTIKKISTGATLATMVLDQSGTGTITYSDNSMSAVTSWMLSQ